jgi:CHAD domain-containing protein
MPPLAVAPTPLRTCHMLKKAKWVNPETPDQPVSEIAAPVIRERLELAWHYLPLAARRWDEDLEYVHQLRVGTRRAAAAMATFEELLPPRRGRRMNKALGQIRRACGEARDLDVLSARLRREIEQSDRQALKPALKQIAQLRRDAQAPIEAILARMTGKRMPAKIDALCRRIRWRLETPEPTYAALGRQLLHRAVDDFFAAAQSDLTITANLHALRIEGKKLRYSMELLAGAFSNSLVDDLYPQVRELQDRLGQLNDHAAAAETFDRWADIVDDPDAQQQFACLQSEEQASLERDKLAFAHWWTLERSEDLEAQFHELLAPV